MPLTTIDWSQDLATWLAADGAPFDVDIEDDTPDPEPPEWANLVRSFVQESYAHHRGTALSVLGRASNTTGEVDHIVAGSDGHVLRRFGTAVGFGQIVAGGITDGTITDAKLANAGARTLKGRSANSSGVPGDIAGSGTAASPQVASDDGSTIAFRALSTLRDTASVIYEVDFSSLANNTFADGAEVIDGITWTVGNSVEAATFDILNGTGLRCVNAVSNGGATTMTTGSQTMPYLYTALSNFSGYRPEYNYVVEIYCSTVTIEQNGEGVCLGTWGPANEPNTGSNVKMRWVGLTHSGGVRVLRNMQGVTTVTGTETLATDNVITLPLNALATGPCMSGTWGSTWPTLSTHVVFHTATAGALDTYNHNGMRLFLSFSLANDASPTTAITVQRMRIRRV